jgi:hypothetical protein
MGKWGGWAAIAAVALLVIWAAWRETKPDRVDEERRLSGADPVLAEASRELLQKDLPGVKLGMSLPDVLTVHARLKRRAQADLEGLRVFEEPLGEKRSALYFFGGERAGIGALMRVQVASSVSGLDAVVARVLETQQRLGPPNGVWDCPASAGQVPTRRYSYRRGVASALDVYTLLGDNAAATYYVSSTRQIRASIKEAGCVETPPERAHRFPMAVPPGQ